MLSSVADNVLHTKPGHLQYDGLMLQRRKTDQEKNIPVLFFDIHIIFACTYTLLYFIYIVYSWRKVNDIYTCISIEVLRTL